MFPIRDDNPTTKTPFVTFAIIGINAMVWILVQGMGTQPALLESLVSFGLIPAELLGTVSAGKTVELGPSFTYTIDASPNWFAPLSSMFMHGGWLHILANMWFLWVFGDNVEEAFGRVRFVAMYLLSGLAAAAAQMAINPSSTVPMVGASGAIGGVMGAYAVLYPRARVELLVFLGFFITTFAVPAIFMLGYWFIIQLVSAMPTLGTAATGGVAFWAHIGGFLMGIVLVYAFRAKAPRRNMA